MKTAVIVLVDGGGGAWCGPVFTVSAAPLSPVVEEAQRDEERHQEEGGSEEEITLGAAPLTVLHTQVSSGSPSPLSSWVWEELRI